MCALVPLRLSGNQPTCSGTKCGMCMPGGPVTLKNLMEMLKMALQIPRLLVQLPPAVQSPMLQRTQLLLEMVPYCFIAVRHRPTDVEKKRCFGSRCRRGVIFHLFFIFLFCVPFLLFFLSFSGPPLLPQPWTPPSPPDPSSAGPLSQISFFFFPLPPHFRPFFVSGEKSAKMFGPHPLGPHPLGPPFGPHPSGHHPPGRPRRPGRAGCAPF